MRIQNITNNIVVMYAPKELELKSNTAPTTAPIVCIALPEELVFVDTGIYVDILREFREKMEEKFSRKTSHLLLTHTDWDHIFAMEVFEDITIVASKKSIESLKYSLEEDYLSEEGRKKWVKNRYPNNEAMRNLILNSKIFLPNKSVKDELFIGPKNNALLYKVIGGHTPGSSIIYSLTEKTLCAGDNLLECYPQLQHEFNNPIPIFEQLEKFDANHYIPGHGKIVSKDYVQKLKKYFIDLEQFLKDSISKKYSITKVLKHPKLPIYTAQDSHNWQPSCRPGDNWLKLMIEDWYEEISESY
ncbi:MAG: MBL fold metallo-hydrolase [Asgard group archaeon]|nr:MBL fold metallo-hydrolase [Asgard group archaeon]